MIDWLIYPILLFITSFIIWNSWDFGRPGRRNTFCPYCQWVFPFHLDFVRCTGLIVALCGSLYAGGKLLKKGLANLRLAIPCALVASISSILGAIIGLSLPTNIIQTSLEFLLLLLP